MPECTKLLRLRFAGALTITHATNCGIWRRSGFDEKSRSVFGSASVFLDQCAHCTHPSDYVFLQFKSFAYFPHVDIFMIPLCKFAL